MAKKTEDKLPETVDVSAYLDEAAKRESPVDIVCTTDLRPFADVLVEKGDKLLVISRGIERNERVRVPVWQADLIVANGHAVIV